MIFHIFRNGIDCLVIYIGLVPYLLDSAGRQLVCKAAILFTCYSKWSLFNILSSHRAFLLCTLLTTEVFTAEQMHALLVYTDEVTISCTTFFSPRIHFINLESTVLALTPRYGFHSHSHQLMSKIWVDAHTCSTYCCFKGSGVSGKKLNLYHIKRKKKATLSTTMIKYLYRRLDRGPG